MSLDLVFRNFSNRILEFSVIRGPNQIFSAAVRPDGHINEETSCISIIRRIQYYFRVFQEVLVEPPTRVRFNFQWKSKYFINLKKKINFLKLTVLR